MKKSDKIAYQQQDVATLAKKISDLQAKLLEYRSKQQLGNLKDTSVFKKVKYEITFIKTLISQKHD